MQAFIAKLKKQRKQDLKEMYYYSSGIEKDLIQAELIKRMYPRRRWS